MTIQKDWEAKLESAYSFILKYSKMTVCAAAIAQLLLLPQTAGLHTIFVQIYMDALTGIPKSELFLQIKLLSLPKIGTNFEKSSKLKKKANNLVFLEYFKYSSISGQYQRTKPQQACLVDPGASFDTPETPGEGSIQNRSRFQYLFLIFLSGAAPTTFFN